MVQRAGENCIPLENENEEERFLLIDVRPRITGRQ